MDIKTLVAGVESTEGNKIFQEVLYQKLFAVSNHTIAFRPLTLPEDLRFIHTWVNQPSAKAFWCLNNKSETFLLETYFAILESPFTHSFIGLLDGTPVCQIDIYDVLHDEIKSHVRPDETAYGIHFLMSEKKKHIHNLSVCCMQTFLSFLFSNENIISIYGEPDIDNDKANQLVCKAGFLFLRTITLSYKIANLYRVTRHDFEQAHLYNL